jgi:hypothetical protein
MKLTEAIRLGATLKPQIYENWFRDGGTCVIASAFDAVGQLDALLKSIDMPKLIQAAGWEQEFITSSSCPACNTPLNYSHLTVMMMHLNDFHKWTREDIASWVETHVEMAVESEAAEACAVQT